MDNGYVEGTYHLHHLGVYVFSDNITLCRDVLQHLVQRLGLDLLPLQIGVGVIKIEKDRALVKFLDEELWTLRRRRFCAKRVSSQEMRSTTQTRDGPIKGGNFSISTFSVITKRLLRCLRGGLTGIVSLGPERSLLSVELRGGTGSPVNDVRSIVSGGEGSALTTTIGGAGALVIPGPPI
jgi:hypothetical protein